MFADFWPGKEEARKKKNHQNATFSCFFRPVPTQNVEKKILKI